MAFALSIKVEDNASPGLKRMERMLGPSGRRQMMQLAGNRVAMALRRHFRARDNSGDSRRARKGWTSRHFWAGVERSTTLSSYDEGQAIVTVADPKFAFKVRGGTITPKRGKYLAIPLTDEAYRKGSPREWDAPKKSEDALVPIRSRGGRLFLAQVKDGYAKGPLGARGIRAQYLLVKSATQKADAQAVPGVAALRAEVEKAREQFIARYQGSKE